MIEITTAAAKRIQELMLAQGFSDGGLRIGVKAGGCSGFSYVYDWASKPKSDDQVFESAEGIKVFVCIWSMVKHYDFLIVRIRRSMNNIFFIYT